MNCEVGDVAEKVFNALRAETGEISQTLFKSWFAEYSEMNDRDKKAAVRGALEEGRKRGRLSSAIAPPSVSNKRAKETSSRDGKMGKVRKRNILNAIRVHLRCALKNPPFAEISWDCRTYEIRGFFAKEDFQTLFSKFPASSDSKYTKELSEADINGLFDDKLRLRRVFWNDMPTKRKKTLNDNIASVGKCKGVRAVKIHLYFSESRESWKMMVTMKLFHEKKSIRGNTAALAHSPLPDGSKNGPSQSHTSAHARPLSQPRVRNEPQSPRAAPASGAPPPAAESQIAFSMPPPMDILRPI